MRLAGVLALWFTAWALNAWLARNARGAITRFLVPTTFGATLLVLWEITVWTFAVSPVILPAPSVIGARFVADIPILWLDFVQTIIKGALSGLLIGSVLAIATALAIDRSAFLQRGLLPVGNFLAALPIVGTAPILVMWFGFGWQSKAAVVAVMVFFPILVNMVQGLKATDRLSRDLMHTYAASYSQSLLKLRLPAAMPFLFNGLKISSTLALIGAIVAEFFGSPVFGMGFRIKTSFGSFDLDLVWAEVAVAALAGSALYGVIALAERAVTFWHPAQRR
ncbi:MAG: ABC transporter permease [Pseudomonadota bacterium]